MTPLALNPLPSARSADDTSPWQAEQMGFVDEAVVAKLLSPGRLPRVQPSPHDLILSADDVDFAGWQLAPSTSPFRGMETIPEPPTFSTRRASPPEMNEPGIGSPHRGNHRWWLAGLAGALSTLLFTVLLLTLSSRPEVKSHAAPAQTAPPAASSQPGMAAAESAGEPIADSRR
ncbi:MAG: hypothetical protein V4640_12730 [Verrucomicrobiota bacterium]